MDFEAKSTVNLFMMWKQRLLSLLSVAIVGMITWCNLPEEFVKEVFAVADRNLSVDNAYQVRRYEWAVRYASHIVGLDSKWQMYGGQSRFNWRYVISAHYGEGDNTTEWILPLPRQSQRTWFQESFLDFKEAKFLLNIYNDELARETYARYLARQYYEHEGLPISTIRFTLVLQEILPPIIAVQEQRILEPERTYDIINEFDVRVDRKSSSRSMLERASLDRESEILLICKSKRKT